MREMEPGHDDTHAPSGTLAGIPWQKKGAWFTSPWNHLKEAREGLAFPQSVRFHDITLRDGEQQAGVTFTRDDKTTIAKRLAAIKVDRIEAGMPAVSTEDEAAIKDIVQLDLGPEIFAFARCMVDDVKRAKDCGVSGVVIEIPSSRHIIEKAYGWPPQRALHLSIEATLAAKEAGLYTVFFTIDSSRAEFEWYLDLVEQVATEGHMDALAMVDTFGGISTHAIPVWAAKLRSRLPDISLEAHFHDDFGLAVANTVAALAAGVEVAHTTVCGIGERAGNTPMEDLALALRMLYNAPHGLQTEHFYALARLVRERAGHSIPGNRAVIGDHLFEVESGIIAGWYERCIESDPTELFPYHWDQVGQPSARVVYGKGSGLPSMALALKVLGVAADDDQMRQVLTAVKERALETKSLVSLEELTRILMDHLKPSE